MNTSYVFRIFLRQVFHVEVLVAENGAVTGALRGRTALPSAAGVVAFTDVAVDRAGERYSLG